MKKVGLVVSVVVILVAGGYFLQGEIRQRFFEPTESTLENGVSEIDEVTIVVRDLEIPWETAFLPGGDVLVTERPGTLRRIGQNEQTYTISGVRHVGEGGLMGMALHPNFVNNSYVYLYLTTSSGDALVNRVERYRLNGSELADRRVILENIPGAANHDGGRIAFGSDGKLYVTTGDAGQPDGAQNKNSLAGKILRLNDDGSIPDDNPFSNAVYSYGHRNPQGIAWDEEGRLWSVEHGPSGSQSGYDELNLIVKGGNYGWPEIRGDETAAGMVAPVVQSGSDETWAPAGLAYYDGSLFFAGLRGESLYEAKIESENNVLLRAHLRGTYGRLRGVSLGPENKLYLTTSNRDGRGQPQSGDDKIIAIDPRLLQ